MRAVLWTCFACVRYLHIESFQEIGLTNQNKFNSEDVKSYKVESMNFGLYKDEVCTL